MSADIEDLLSRYGRLLEAHTPPVRPNLHGTIEARSFAGGGEIPELADVSQHSPTGELDRHSCPSTVRCRCGEVASSPHRRRSAGAVACALVAASVVGALWLIASPGSSVDRLRAVDTAPAPTPAALRPDTTEPQADLPLDLGEAIAYLTIDAIGLDDVVVAGVRAEDLRTGVGHLPGSAMPGELANAVLVGHRTTYGQPFADLDRLAPGDEIQVVTPTGSYVYRVVEQSIVAPTALNVIAGSTDESRLTLVTCSPRFSSRQRLVVVATLDEAASAPVPPRRGRLYRRADVAVRAGGVAAGQADCTIIAPRSARAPR